MARKLPATDVVIVGLGWTGSMLAHELTANGLNVVAIERGPWRDTATALPFSWWSATPPRSRSSGASSPRGFTSTSDMAPP